MTGSLPSSSSKLHMPLRHDSDSDSKSQAKALPPGTADYNIKSGRMNYSTLRFAHVQAKGGGVGWVPGHQWISEIHYALITGLVCDFVQEIPKRVFKLWQSEAEQGRASASGPARFREGVGKRDETFDRYLRGMGHASRTVAWAPPCALHTGKEINAGCLGCGRRRCRDHVPIASG
ncbi:hypothetical protein GALMADRAFT_214024 [Galerina marginata CBS 339.88]|uniref:Uncharacterized protein n=1 Tax=Galerina marginata (strain CBS 339.88) TaxID=685588 RepID=A0A067SMZ1_GALM3|nr:hypothetical protein GALMADRAFT_214024 [Galerina marginata CBS 339.88]